MTGGCQARQTVTGRWGKTGATTAPFLSLRIRSLGAGAVCRGSPAVSKAADKSRPMRTVTFIHSLARRCLDTYATAQHNTFTTTRRMYFPYVEWVKYHVGFPTSRHRLYFDNKDGAWQRRRWYSRYKTKFTICLICCYVACYGARQRISVGFSLFRGNEILFRENEIIILRERISYFVRLECSLLAGMGNTL